MENIKTDLELLKEKYEVVKGEHDLPFFDELNCEFQIEKISEIETDFLLREIRRFISEKFSGYLRFIEAILHPVNSQIFVFSIIKSIGIEEKRKLENIYKVLSKREVEVIILDIDFSEEKEAIFIKESYSEWKEVKKDLLSVVNVVRLNWDSKSESNGKDYFG